MPIAKPIRLNEAKRRRVRRLLSEKAKRAMETLRIYTPLPNQLAFHKSEAPERLAIGCLAGDTLVYDPVADVELRLDKICEPFHVYASDNGKRVVARADPPFLKGRDELLTVTLTTGHTFVCTGDHRVQLASGEWVTINHIEYREPNALLATMGGDDFLGVAVARIDPCGYGKFYDFNVPVHHNYELCGIVHHNSNRGGKTSAMVAELGWILTNTHPYLKYPQEGGRCFVVGADGRHLSEVFFRKLFVAGAFRMIRDLETGKWRWVDPKKDADRKGEIKPAPPLIPSRFIQGGWKGISWENKRERIPSLIRMTNGWEIRFFPGGALPPNGVDVDVVAMDEEVPDIWYSEMSARLLDRKGRFIWSATPQAGTSTLLELHERAEKERTLMADGSLKTPTIQQFDMLLDSNPHIDDEQKRLLELKFRNDPQNYRIRVLGEFIAKSYRMYPDFNEFVHGYSLDEFKQQYGVTDIPRDWTRYMAVDPGHTCAAALFIAVPPHEVAEYVIAYDELYIYNCNAELFAQRAALKVRGQPYEAFIMDLHGGARREVGLGVSIEQQYAAQFAKYKIQCHRTGHNFHWGNSDVESGCERVRALLRIRDDGTPRLKIIRDRVPNFIMEMKKYRKKILKNKDGTNTVSDAPDQRRDNHLCDCMRYLACYDLRYVHPKLRVRSDGSPLQKYLAKKERRKTGQDGRFVNLGPTMGVSSDNGRNG